jgi:hypothetical protein
MNRKTVLICLVVALLAYTVGSRSSSPDRPILRWISRAVGVWLMFRDEPPQERPSDNARYVHAIGPADGIDHRNAL